MVDKNSKKCGTVLRVHYFSTKNLIKHLKSKIHSITEEKIFDKPTPNQSITKFTETKKIESIDLEIVKLCAQSNLSICKVAYDENIRY